MQTLAIALCCYGKMQVGVVDLSRARDHPHAYALLARLEQHSTKLAYAQLQLGQLSVTIDQENTYYAGQLDRQAVLSEQVIELKAEPNKRMTGQSDSVE